MRFYVRLKSCDLYIKDNGASTAFVPDVQNATLFDAELVGIFDGDESIEIIYQV